MQILPRVNNRAPLDQQVAIRGRTLGGRRKRRTRLPEITRGKQTRSDNQFRKLAAGQHTTPPCSIRLYERGSQLPGFVELRRSVLSEGDEFNFDAPSVQPGHLDRGAGGWVRWKVTAVDFAHRLKIIHIF